DVSGLKSWQAKADEFMDFARGSMLRMENEKLPIAKIALETADGHTDKLANHDRRIHKVENLTEDHGNRIWALEQAAGK
ncbi:MAG: hypothetical protein LBR85_07680, partial [Oscillospiraceae bacterium]|nr:hypothetical protein [Oscillospiraceae bacterium]